MIYIFFANKLFTRKLEDVIAPQSLWDQYLFIL